jgi:hypothetical protein
MIARQLLPVEIKTIPSTREKKGHEIYLDVFVFFVLPQNSFILKTSICVFV